jgi:hypothetical protein
MMALVPDMEDEMKFDVNVGSTDRMLRIGVGVLLIVLAVIGTIGAWGYIGIVPVITGFVRFCPAYTLLGMNTCGKSA